MQSSAHINRKNLRIQLQHLSFRQTQKLMFMITIIIQLIPLNEGGDSRTLHNSIESVSERDSSSGDGSSAGNAYIYYLNVNGRVKSSVIKSLHDSKKYATFIEFDENGRRKERYEYNPDRVFTDLEEDGLYKVSDFDNLTIRPAYKDLKADKVEDGQKDSNGKYIFYLQKGGKISGSLLNDLIKRVFNAEFVSTHQKKIMTMRIQRMQIH